MSTRLWTVFIGAGKLKCESTHSHISKNLWNHCVNGSQLVLHKQCCMAITMYFVRSEKGGRERERKQTRLNLHCNRNSYVKGQLFCICSLKSPVCLSWDPLTGIRAGTSCSGLMNFLKLHTQNSSQPQLTKLARMHEKPKSRLLLSDNCSLWHAFVIDLNCNNKWVIP